MAHEYDTVLRQALELHPAERAKLVEALARSLANEAGIDPETAMLAPETAKHLDDNLAKAKALEDARIQAAIEKAMKRRDG